STSPCIAGRWRCGDGLRPRAAQSSPLRPAPRSLAARQRLAVRGRAGHLSPAPRAIRGAGGRGDARAGDDRFHPGAREPAGEPGVRPGDGSVLRPTPRDVRPGARVAGGDRRCGPRAARALLEGAPHAPAGAVPLDRRRLDRRLSAPRGARPPRDHRIRGHTRLPAAPQAGGEHPAAAGGGQGGPGDEWYLEFHKIRWPGGLKLWRVSGANVDLGGKRPYEPPVASQRAADHAAHFTHLLQGLPDGKPKERDGVIVAPFDTELFGHWWFEGADFLAATYR